MNLKVKVMDKVSGQPAAGVEVKVKAGPNDDDDDASKGGDDNDDDDEVLVIALTDEDGKHFPTS